MDTLRSLVHLFALCSICIIVSTFTLYSPDIRPKSSWRTTSEPFPSDTASNLFWFVQISDIHISRFLDPERAPDFKKFCTTTLDLVKPDLVLVTGDLTDAKHKNRVGSEQYEDEWITYDKIISESNVTEKYVWLDVRGNHDAFDVLHVDDPNSNYYLKYSGDKGRMTSKVYHHKKSFGTYSFIPVDATMIPGPRRPYNFIGYLDNKRMKKLGEEALETHQSNFTIWYSHYPSAFITSADPGLTTLVGQRGGAYLAGHLHTLSGLANKMYAMNTKGFLELELGDWMDSRRWRIMAVDHDMLSFTDLTHGDWPAIVLTNPKPAKFMMPLMEALGRMAKSTHIRFLIFNPSEIKNVEVKIDGVALKESPRHIKDSPLWVCRWQPGLYNKGMHNITITVIDSQQNKSITQEFSLDSSWKLDFDPLSVFVLVTDLCSLVFYGFYTLSILYMAAILFGRFYLQENSSTSLLSKFCLLMKDDFVFKGTFLFALNLMWGPWFIGELVTAKTGICFSHGLLIDGKFQSESTLNIYGIIMILLFYSPCLLYLAQWNFERKASERSKHSTWSIRSRLLTLSFVLYVLLYLKWCFAVYQAYGLMASIVCPSRLWWLCFVLYNVYKIRTGTVLRHTL